MVKEVEPYSLFLCPEDFSTQNQMDIRKKHLSKKGMWVSRSALQEERAAHGGRSSPSVSWAEKPGDGGEPPLWASLGGSSRAPSSKPAALYPAHLHCLSSHRKANQQTFCYLSALICKKESFGKLGLNAEESKGFWGSFHFYCLT